MTVKDLIELLQTCEPSAGVYWADERVGEFTPVAKVEDYGGRVWLGHTLFVTEPEPELGDA